MMPPQPATLDPALDENDPTARLVEAGVYSTAEAGFDHGLVVLASGHAYWLTTTTENGFRLLVEPDALATVRRQLAAFDRESVGWPPQPLSDARPTRPVEMFTPMLWAIVVLVAFRLQIGRPALANAGALDAQAVFERGEWWRPITALFLHADSAHVIANALSGLFVFAAVLTTLGRRRGWLLIALAALAGNIAIAALHYPAAYRSLGASTAVFAGLGVLTGRALGVAWRAERGQRWRAILAPLGAGCTVLALYGAGGVGIDVGAHVTGFAAGLIAGAIEARCVLGGRGRA